MGGKQRIGLLGGTFNPVHTGHLLLAQSALEAFDMDRVLFIPCAIPPHKGAPTPSARHRCAMLEAAIELDVRFETCDIELRRGGVSYAIDTVRELQPRYPDAELLFILGMDSLLELHLWKDIGELLKLCRFVTFGRPGSTDTVSPQDLRLDAPWPERLLADLRPNYLMNVSSSDIRHRLAEGMSIRYLVPDAVAMYIAEHGLYK